MFGPAVFAVLTAPAALATALLLGTVLALLVLGAERRRLWVRRRDVSLLLVAAAPGVPLGLLVLALVSKPVLQVAVGATVVAAALVEALRERLTRRRRSPPVPLWVAVPSGFAAGVLTTTTTANGPPLVLFLQGREATPSELRDSNAAMLLVLNALAGALLLGAEGPPLDPDVAVLILLIAVVAAGYLVGRWLFERLDHRRFHVLGLVLVVAAGVASVVAGLVA